MKKISLLLPFLLLLVLNIPFSFARTKTGHSVAALSDNKSSDRLDENTAYDSLSLQMKGLSREAFRLALLGFEQLVERGTFTNDSLLTIVDLSQPSSHKRLYVIDLKNYRILFHSLVAHGRNSGTAIATHFSNASESYMSSPGFYTTGTTYTGHNGYSLRLEGLEKGINDKAMERSQGCPAVPISLAKPLINTIRNGSCVFVYHPSYVPKSRILANS